MDTLDRPSDTFAKKDNICDSLCFTVYPAPLKKGSILKGSICSFIEDTNDMGVQMILTVISLAIASIPLQAHSFEASEMKMQERNLHFRSF